MLTKLYNTHAIFYELIDSDYKMNGILERCFDECGYIKETVEDRTFVSFRNEKFQFIFTPKFTIIFENHFKVFHKEFKKDESYDYFL